MAEPKNIQIPYTLFKSLLEVLEYIDISNYAEDFQSLYNGVLEGLQDKKKRIELREVYGKLAAANKTEDEDAQTEARIEYLRKKNNPFY